MATGDARSGLSATSDMRAWANGRGWRSAATRSRCGSGVPAKVERSVILKALAEAHARGDSHCYSPHWRAVGAEVIAARVVDDGNLIFSGGVTSGLVLALWLVERFLGPALAATIAEQIEYEQRGTV